MAECCLQDTLDFTNSFQNNNSSLNTGSESETSPPSSPPMGVTIQIPQSIPLLYSSFIEQQSQTVLDLCLFQDQVIIAQDCLAKSTLIFDGMVKFGIYSEIHGTELYSSLIFSKNEQFTSFLFLNQTEAQFWYMKLLELRVPQLLYIGYSQQPSSFEQQEQLLQQQLANTFIIEKNEEMSQEKIKTYTLKPSIFKYESMNIPYPGGSCTSSTTSSHSPSSKQINQTINKCFGMSSSETSSFFYKLILTRNIRCNFQQDALILQQVLNEPSHKSINQSPLHELEAESLLEKQ